MKVPVEWLSEHVDVRISIDELAERLTMAGLEVEEVEHISPAEVKKHGGEGVGVEDRVLTTTVTPNRGDWLSIIGTAREVAAVLGEPRKVRDPGGDGTGAPASDFINIEILDPDLCSRYVGMVIRNITIKKSPGWMKDRLIRAGMRPINNIVDITNYVMLEYGQPLHAFDYDLLRGQKILVRRAWQDEKIVSIDGIARDLHKNMLVIADADRAVAIAGVMGGADSEVSAETKHILLESAHFDPVSIRRTSKALGMVTESSYRFERVVDPGVTAAAARRAAELMQELADGEIASGMVDAHPRPPEELIITVDLERVNRLLGTELPAGRMVQFLRQLEIPVRMENKLYVTAPTFRPDIKIEADVVEEIGRMYGYENIGCSLPSSPLQGTDSPNGKFAEVVRSIAISCGAQEVVSHTLVDPHLAELAGTIDRLLRVRNPLSGDLASLRTMLAPNLLQVIALNQTHGERDISIFEVGKIFHESNGEPDESNSFALAMVGSQWAKSWSLDSSTLEADFYLCKGALEALLDRLAVKDVEFTSVLHPLLHPARAAGVSLAGTVLGMLGEVAPDVSERMGVRGRACVFELDLDALRPLVPEQRTYKEAPRYPGLHRDVAVVAKKDVPYAHLERVVREVGGEILEAVDVKDVYTGSHIGEHERSITVSLEFRSRERTLTDEEVSSVVDLLKQSLAKRLQVSFRT